MALARESAFLPTIKCSQCGSQVEISMMGEHVCSGPPAELSPPPEADEGFASLAPPSRYGRKPGPVDIGAANQPYLQQQDTLTPISQISHSPGTPLGRPSPGSANGYFTTTPDGLDAGSSPMQIRRPGGYGGFGAQEGYSEPIPSPGIPGTPGLLKRMDTIAPGPFDANRRPSMAESMRKPSLTPMQQEDAFRTQDRPGTSHSNLSTLSKGSGDNVVPPRMPRKSGYEGFGPPLRAGDDARPPPLGFINRSETFPRPSFAMEPPARTPSAPGTRPDRSGQINGSGPARKPSTGPDTSRRPPPRKSLIAPASQRQASVDLAAEFGASNPYHTPSDSASSGYSGFSQTSHPSSQSSPARSQTRQEVPEMPKMDDLVDEVEKSMESLQPQGLRIDPRGPSTPTPDQMVESPLGMSPDNRAAGSASQGRRFDDLSPRSLDRPPTQQQYGTSPQRAGPGPRMGTTPPSRQGTRDMPSRGDCKACGLPIKGKSISSADGRLTGKYHKPCFVCTTCSEPFTSAEFYVLDDKPYCEQHYHKLNGSLCGSCGRGIEGHYVEDEASTKYHVGCFSCLDCGRPLTDGYFEVDGKSYCEQDARRRTQPPPPPPQPHVGSYPPYDPYQQQQFPPRRAPGPRPQPQGMPGLPGRPTPGGGGPVPRPRGPPGQQPMPRPAYGHGPGPGSVRPGAGKPPPSAFLGAPRPPMMNKRSTRLGRMGPA